MSNEDVPGFNEFAAAKARKRALAAQLSRQPVEDVIGLIDASGRGGWSAEGDKWTLQFTFHTWRVLTGPMKPRPLSVEMTASREEYDRLWERVHSYSIVRIRARVIEDSVVGTPQAALVEFLGPDSSDAELNQAAVDLQKPVVQHDPQFGALTLDRSVNWYTTETEWNGTAIDLNVTLDESGTTDLGLRVARALWKNQQRWTKRVEDYAVQELLALKNEAWLDEGEAPVTAAEFRARMTLESVTVEPDGSFDFWHHDGDLFWGHSIQVSGTLAAGLTQAGIAG